MTVKTADEKLPAYLRDAHALEDQALVQMLIAPLIAGQPQLREAFRTHASETREHRRLVRERLASHASAPSRLRDGVMSAGGVGFALFAACQGDTPGKLAAHGYSYEHLELGAYELLAHLAERAGDEATADAARSIAGEEEAMARRLASSFERSTAASLDGEGASQARLVRYLRDAHALEQQAHRLLALARRTGGEVLREDYESHLDETDGHLRALEERLRSHGAQPSRLKDAALAMGAVNWGLFFQAQADTPVKLAAFAFAFEHLEIAGYEQLRRVAARLGDEETAAAADRILEQERAAAERIRSRFGAVIDATLSA